MGWQTLIKEVKRACLNMVTINEGIFALSERVSRLSDRVDQLIVTVSIAKKEAPILCIMCEGDTIPSRQGEESERVTLGKWHRMTSETPICLRTMVSMTNVRVTIFADLERVQIRGVRLGVNEISAADGCPIVFARDRWDPAVLLQVHAQFMARERLT